jgi:hypothetical protein
LRRQQCAETRHSGFELKHIGGDKAVEETPRAVAGHFDRAAVLKQGSFHAANA